MGAMCISPESSCPVAVPELKPTLSPISVPPASLFGKEIRSIAMNLREGSRGDNVIMLKQFLVSQNKGSSAKALIKVSATNYFDTLTRAALAEFQIKAGIKPALGNFGPITRRYISLHY